MNDAESSSHLSRRTTPTWEVELLISGVAVFAMLQVPGWLDDRMFALEPRVGSDWRPVLVLFYIYSKSTAVVLAATFAIHLLLRAQWIALVGMDSVYPQGVQLDRLRMGPIQRAIEGARPGTIADAIERADNRASVLFAIGVSIATIIASICIFFCGSLLLVNLLAQAFAWPIDPLKVMWGIFGLVMLPFASAGMTDQLRGDRLRPDGIVYRTVAATLRFYTRIGMGRRNNHVIALLTSNGGERRMMAVVFGVMLAALAGVGVAYAAMRTSTRAGSYRLFPDSALQRLLPEHYDDQRNPARDPALPFVQSSVIAGPYLKLVVPYRPDRDEAAMRKHCTQASGLGGEALASARRACLQALHPVALDGTPLQDLQYEIASDPRTDRPALLAMIDVRTLAPGRHELRIARPPRGDRKPGKDDEDPGFDTIPFWR